jgi:hypothetical protein
MAAMITRQTGGESRPQGGISAPCVATRDRNTGNHREDGGVLSSSSVEDRMPDNHDRKGSTSGGTLAIIAAVFIVALAVLTWGPWNIKHVDSNPGPSGTPGTTALEQTPPPAASPSGSTTGTGR